METSNVCIVVLIKVFDKCRIPNNWTILCAFKILMRCYYDVRDLIRWRWYKKNCHKHSIFIFFCLFYIMPLYSLIKKLFRCIMEAKLSAWVAKYFKRACGQASFWKHHNIYDLVTLRMLMEEQCLKGNANNYIDDSYKQWK